MTLIYPNIVPENNLRLPDALTIKHGPARLLARFVLEGDKSARQMGLRLRLRHDFGELVYLNKQEISRGNWFRLVNMFNPEYSDVSPENAFWVSGEDQNGEIAVTWAGRVYYWPETNLAEQACVMFFGRDEGQPCKGYGACRRVDHRRCAECRLGLGAARVPWKAAFPPLSENRTGLCLLPVADRLDNLLCSTHPRRKRGGRRLWPKELQSQYFLPAIALG